METLFKQIEKNPKGNFKIKKVKPIYDMNPEQRKAYLLSQKRKLI